MASLQTHEARINKPVVKIEEKAFHVKSEASNQLYDSKNEAKRGCGRGGYRGRGDRGRGRRRGEQDRQRQSFDE